MEFTSVQEVLSKTQGELKLCLINLKMGSGCTECLFKNDNVKSLSYFNNQTYDENRISNENPFPQFPLIFTGMPQFFFEFSAIFGPHIQKFDHKIMFSTNKFAFTAIPN